VAWIVFIRGPSSARWKRPTPPAHSVDHRRRPVQPARPAMRWPVCGRGPSPSRSIPASVTNPSRLRRARPPPARRIW